MRHGIETAPRDETIVVLEDDASGSFDIAHWSAEACGWIGQNGKPTKITPTHWHRSHVNYQYFLQDDERQPRRRRRRRFAVFPIVAMGFLAIGLMGLYFIDSLYFEVFHSHGSQETGSSLRQRAEADQPRNGTIGESPKISTNGRAVTRGAMNEPDRQLLAEHASIGHDHQQTPAVREATAARRDLAAPTERHRQTFEEELVRRVTLASELAEARREVQTQSEQYKKDIGSAWKQKQTAESITVELRQALQQEHNKTAALTKEVKAATTAAELLGHAVEDARRRVEALLNELAEARREVQAQAEQSKKAAETALEEKQTAETLMAELRQSLHQERERAETNSSGRALAPRELEAQTLSYQEDGQVSQLIQGGVTATQLADARPRADGQSAELPEANEEAEATPTLEGKQAHSEDAIPKVEAAEQPVTTTDRQPRVSPKSNGDDAVRWIARAKSLVSQGNIRAARDVLERAAETGSAQALFALAETYDPNVLAAWKTRGTVGDATRAHGLNEKAYGRGHKAAKDRFRALVIANDERKPIGFFGR
jgi:hypothetical protein